jgi:hypothetical protein
MLIDNYDDDLGFEDLIDFESGEGKTSLDSNVPTNTNPDNKDNNSDDALDNLDNKDQNKRDDSDGDDDLDTSNANNSSNGNDDDPADNTSSGVDYSALYNVLSEEGILQPDEDFKFSNTLEDLEAVIEQTKVNQQKAIFTAFWERLPEEWQQGLSYAVKGGDIKTYLDTFKSVSLQDIDITSSAENQRYVVTQYYKQTTPHSDERIAKFVDRLQASGELEAEAASTLEELQKIENANRDKLLAERDAEIEENERRSKERRDSIISVIDENVTDTTKRGKVKAFIFNTLKIGDKQDTQLNMYLNSAINNTAHLAQLAEFFLDNYNPKEGFTLKAVNSKAASKATLSLKEKLAAFDANSKTNLKGSASKTTKDSFDIEAFLLND